MCHTSNVGMCLSHISSTDFVSYVANMCMCYWTVSDYTWNDQKDKYRASGLLLCWNMYISLIPRLSFVCVLPMAILEHTPTHIYTFCSFYTGSKVTTHHHWHQKIFQKQANLCSVPILVKCTLQKCSLLYWEHCLNCWPNKYMENLGMCVCLCPCIYMYMQM